ncbi:uncharacterized protein LOC124543462 [Vanessa cardui]|uniref:uncharacterized protein LOC124543462 n=1 Tax=Vanessa cardui TaxID=171605 RepID=UPI001F14024C|nr:uncharacterized protein LOC124543462 [Vanessa cardui]
MKQHPGTQVIQCTRSRQKPVKAAIVVFGDRLEVVHDPQIVTENVAAVFLRAGQLRLGLLSVYFEGDQDLHPYLQQIRSAINKVPTNNLLVAGDVNAWSHWWGSNSEDHRGADYHNFITEMDLHILNTGSVPTFETYRGDRLYASCVDVTLTSQSLLGRMEDWRVDRSLVTSDHNAITFNLRLERPLEPLKPISTRKYNTKKAKWSDFSTYFRMKLVDSGITLERVSALTTPEELEEMFNTYTSTIHGSCESTIPKMKAWKGDPRPPWWSAILEDLKKDVLRKKRRIRNAAPCRRHRVIQEYVQAREDYKGREIEAVTQSWKEFCSTQDRESVWDGVYRVIRKTSKRSEDLLLRDSAGETLTPEKSAELLARTFYPDDSVETENAKQRSIRAIAENKTPEEIQDLSDDDPPFTTAELEMVLMNLNPKKAPGPDGLTSDICTAAINCDREVFLALANKCLMLSYFPNQWKVAHVCILRKPAKEDYTHPKSYRPIGLLSILGKIVEKLLVGRLQYHLLPTLHPSQYGFMPQRGTEDALYDLVGHIQKEIRSKKIVLLVSLDIEGAFDNAWWPALKKQLVKKHCPRNLYALVTSYLQDRRVIVNYARATSEKGTTKGCVQGSIGGPTFWNLILDSLLHEMATKGVYCQAFADDVVLVFSNHHTSQLQATAESTLAAVQEWGTENKLSFAPHKTNAMVLTKKLKYDAPVIHMCGTPLSLVTEIKLLGLIIDSKLTFNAHVSATCKKAADIYKQLACAAKVTWGLNGEIVRTIYVAVIEPIVLYAASVWSPAVEKLMIQSKLNSLQRGFAQKICKAYRTVSLTSALILSGQLPLDLRVKEAATLFKIKKGYCVDLIPPGREIERRVGPLQNPHPSQLITTEYACLESLDPQTLDEHHIVGPLIFTDGSKIEGKVGAALTWWDQGRETRNSTFRLEPHNTVFQSEMYALLRAIIMVRKSKHRYANILSDSRSSLDLLRCPSVTHPLAIEMKECIRQIGEEGRSVRFFWLRAHAGTPGNERADELAKKAALTKKTAPDYDRVPISYVKRRIREETVEKWQARYDSSETGSVTKIFLPDVKVAKKVVRTSKITPVDTQLLTGHGGFAAYLHRFKIKDSPSCVCDPECEETIFHLILECPRFGRDRLAFEMKTNITLNQSTLHTIMEKEDLRTPFLTFARTAVQLAAKRNSSSTAQPSAPAVTANPQSTHNDPAQHATDQYNSTYPTTTRQPPDTTPQPQPQTPQNTDQTSLRRRLRALSNTMRGLLMKRNHPTAPLQPIHYDAFAELTQDVGERGVPGIVVKGVALFMSEESESLGISFCRWENSDRVTVSPGLALLIKGSTSKVSIKRATIDALTMQMPGALTCRLVRSKKKVVALFEWGRETPFALACSQLSKIGEETQDGIPRRISVDAMRVGPETGDVADHYGCLTASTTHEVVVYEDRGEDLGFLKPKAAPSLPSTVPTTMESPPSESERLQNKLAAQRSAQASYTRKEPDLRAPQMALINKIQDIVSPRNRESKSPKTDPGPSTSTNQKATAMREFLRSNDSGKPKTTRTGLTKADRGQVTPPKLTPASNPRDHAVNAYVEFQAIVKATREVHLATCNKILQTYRRANEKLLEVELQEAEAAIYNNDTSQTIKGRMSGRYMAAYSAAKGFVGLVEAEGRGDSPLKFLTPVGDPIVVVARCTRIMLDDRILEMAKSISTGPENEAPLVDWELPRLSWINGVPGCGKTAHIVKNFDEDTEVVATTTLEAAKDIREHLTNRFGHKAKSRVRTMASILVNGLHEDIKCDRLTVDEALMNHFGAIVMAARLTGAKEVTLVGDINQLPYIDRENLFEMRYCRPNLTTDITHELSCTYRCPMDVAYAISDVYRAIYSANPVVHSLKMDRFTGAKIPTDQAGTLYLVYTQEEKKLLIDQGYGRGEGSRVMTIHEAQGQTYGEVIIVQTRRVGLSIHRSVPHAVVAITRHTNTCAYYTDCYDDAIGHFIGRAVGATSKTIMEHSLKMAIHQRNNTVAEAVLTLIRDGAGSVSYPY